MYRKKNQQISIPTILSELTGFEILKIILSGIIASIISVVTSALVNTTLVEISINSFFAFVNTLFFYNNNKRKI